MKIVAISDIHGFLPELPECDVVCICGDIMPLQIQRDNIRSVSWLCQEFKPWVNKLPCRHVIFIAGNHDFIFERLGPEAARRPNEVMEMIFGNYHNDDKLIYLRDESVIIDDIKFYGSPWCPELNNWAFYKPQSDLFDVFYSIHDDTDILLTHCPPRIGEAGVVLQDGWNKGKDFGSVELATALIDKPNIKWVLSGHIHSGSHEPVKKGNTNIVNVSLKDEGYNVKYEPFIFEI